MALATSRRSLFSMVAAMVAAAALLLVPLHVDAAGCCCYTMYCATIASLRGSFCDDLYRTASGASTCSNCYSTVAVADSRQKIYCPGGSVKVTSCRCGGTAGTPSPTRNSSVSSSSASSSELSSEDAAVLGGVFGGLVGVPLVAWMIYELAKCAGLVEGAEAASNAPA